MSSIDGEYLAVIRDIHIGRRDAPYPVYFFEVDTVLHGASLQCYNLEDERTIHILNNCYKLEDLEGKPCKVHVKNSGTTIVFKELVK